jgi:hypothetical protein
VKNVTRRSFVRIAGGGLAGSTLVPLVAADAAAKQASDRSGEVVAEDAGKCASSYRIAPPPGADADIYLSPAALSMPLPRIALPGRSLRLFSLRGSTSFRGRTVTGLKAMIYPPLNLSDPQTAPPLGLSEGGFFNLSFRERETGTLIQDIQDEFGDPLYLNSEPRSTDRMGPAYKDGEASSILLTQDAHWWPHCYVRTGVYNGRTGGRRIAFRVRCAVYLSNVADEIYLELELENRTEEDLSLIVIPDQPRPSDREHGGRKAVFQREEGDFTLEAVSDMEGAGNDGWRVDLPPRLPVTRHVALLLKHKEQQPTPMFQAEIRDRIEKSVAAHVEELRWASDRLPQIHTANAMLDEFYKRSILSVLFCRRVRENYCVSPFYDLGYGRGAAVAWDTSFSSRLIAQLDPEGLMGMVRAFLRAGGALHSTYLTWEGKCFGWYAQSPFALMEMVCDFMRLTGETHVLDEKIGGSSLLEYLKDAGKEFLNHYTAPNGLIDIGEGTRKMLELRTFGYEHMIATVNALAVDYYKQLSSWCAKRGDTDARLFASAAQRIEPALNQLLWDEKAGWYGCLYPNGTRTMVLSYHAFDMLRSSAVPAERKRRMAERIREGEFLAPFGMYSISLSDRDHWDLEDCDWGGGGQYVGQPLRIADALYTCGESKRAWRLLSRCAKWVERFPYFPQTIYGDELKLQEHQVDWPLEISAGAGAQAVIGGVFGLQPQLDGSLVITPHWNSTLGEVRLTNYRFRGHTYEVQLARDGFSVSTDGGPAAKHVYSSAARLPARS